jgi:hypothetical protein
MESHLEWTSPAPLWRGDIDYGNPAVRQAFRTPAILRFASDDFMPEFLSVLDMAPQRLTEFVAVPERWDAPPVEPVPAIAPTGLRLKLVQLRRAAVRRLEARGVSTFNLIAASASGTKPLKLFQPAHQRFYMVAACLVCRAAGLPDRRIDTSAQEKTTYILRMLRPRPGAAAVNPDPAQCDELALVDQAWQPASSPTALLDGEQQYPLSGVTYTEDDQRKRRLMIGLIPVGQRDALLGKSQPAIVGQPLIETRQMLLKIKLFEPWDKLEKMANTAVTIATTPGFDGKPLDAGKVGASIALANQQVQAGSYYILLDFAKWLETNLPDLWEQVHTNGNGASLPAAQQSILATLKNTSCSGLSFRSALAQAYDASAQLESVTSRYLGSGTAGWPSFPFQFVTASPTGVTGLTPPLDRTVFEPQIMSAIVTPPAQPQPPVRAVAQANANPNATVWFTIRCVLERPNCTSFSPALLSEPSASFQLAAFFDPDAPARPIRIGLPIDTTPAGLRKFDKNTAFVMSDVLCGQVSKMASLSFMDLVLSILPFPLHSDLPASDMKPCGPSGTSWGMVCSFSIPIITIVAMILLMIFVKLLDIVFFWMPFFQICLPLPNFSAKEQ